MQIILVVVHLFLAIGLVGLILIQHGKGADLGAAFGSGASATVFGAQGSASFLTRATGAFATLFFLTSMALAYYAAQGQEEVSILDSLQPGEAATQTEQQPREVPAPPSSAPSQTDVPLAPVPETTAPASPEASTPDAAAEQSQAVPTADVPSAPAPAEGSGNKSE